MDGKEYSEKPKNPREKANPLSALTFSYILKLFWIGYNRDLEVSDLFTPLKEHKSNQLGEKISRLWEEEVKKINQKEANKKRDAKSKEGEASLPEPPAPSLLKILVKCFGLELIFLGVVQGTMEIVLRLLQPIFIGKVLEYFGNKSSTVSREDALLYATGVVLCSAVNVFVVHPYMMGILHLGMKMRVACCTLIYRKALKLSRTALGETTVGQAVNLLSNDVNRFDVCTIFLHYLWIGPLQTLIVMWLMYQYVGVGYSAVVGIAVLMMFIPLQGYLGKKSSSLRLKTAMRTDERIRLTNEIISGIQAIKMYTWEYPFSRLIENARRKEINVLKGMSYIRGVIMSFIIFSTRLSLFVTILIYIYTGDILTAQKVFMMQAFFNILRTNMTVFFPQGITQIAEGLVSVRRLQNFMMREEVSTRKDRSMVYKKNKTVVEENNKLNNNGIAENNQSNKGFLNLMNVSTKWLSYVKEDTLQNINLEVKPGELVAIVGQVGSGKTSLLNVILKELPVTTGSVNVNGHIAYASQEPWLFAGTVRQNILFGRKMNNQRYEEVVKVCQLKRDFRLFPYADKTIVGERGTSLSGGQRARINLARAVYSDAPIYLFDDPLSAVDAHVGKHMFEECIYKYLKNRTRILVTHQIQYLKSVDRIIVLKNGKIKAQGTFHELAANGIDFGRLLENQLGKSEKQDESNSVPASRAPSRQGSISSVNSIFMVNESNYLEDPNEVAETRTVGSVGSWVYAGYFKAGGSCCFIFTTFLLTFLAQFFASAGDYFIALWVGWEENEKDITKREENGFPSWLDSNTCRYIYTGVTVLTIITALVRSAAFFNMCMTASRNLHDAIFRSISRATMRFFNTNSSGRVLNRFSKDMGAVDELLPLAFIDTVQIGLTLLGIIIVVATKSPFLLIPTFIVGFIFYILRVIYTRTGRSVKRLEGITRSPVFGHLSATLQGLATIRSFEADETLINEFDNHQDLHSSAWYIFIATSRAFGFYLDLFCVIYIAMVVFSFFIIGDEYDGPSVGLAITQSIGITGMFQWGMRQSAELENQMTSVERILEYSNLPSEPPLESTPDKKPKDTWPEEGKIAFKNVYLSYSPDDPPVLKNLNFTVNPREKIGIVGRTGAGKSSLIQALFRLADIKGRIEIDGIESGEIGLHDLRSKISIIPQEPFLFSGTLRRNLDPFNNHNDDVLWRALEETELKESFSIEDKVTEGGSNLSVGQRQLVCLARAIVKNNQILVLDEATANVDLRTDELIQKTIRSKFARCTVLTIAHRLNTVMDSDKILVMDAGTPVEFDHPHVLLQKESGYLKSMVQETGSAMAEALKKVAENSYNNSSQTRL